MIKSHWREYCAPIIAKVLDENKGKPEAVIKKALLEAYPFGQRKMHPYKIWLNEIQRQRGLVKVKGMAHNPNQLTLL